MWPLIDFLGDALVTNTLQALSQSLTTEILLPTAKEFARSLGLSRATVPAPHARFGKCPRQAHLATVLRVGISAARDGRLALSMRLRT